MEHNMLLRKGFFHSLLEYDTISSLLPYGTYDPQKGLYFSENYSVALMILEVAPQPYLTENFLDSLSSIMTLGWPKQSLLQTILFADSNVDPFLRRYMGLRGDRHTASLNQDREFLYGFSSEICDFVKEHVFGGVHSQHHPVPFRNFRSFIVLRVSASVDDFKTGRLGVAILAKAKDSMISSLRAAQIPHLDVEPDHLIRFLYRVWNPQATTDPEDWDQSRFIREQIIRADTPLSIYNSGMMKIGGRYVSVKTPKQYKEDILPAHINMLSGDIGVANSKQINCPFFLTTWVNLEPQNNAILSKGNFVLAQKAATATLGARHQRKQDEYREAMHRIDNNAERFYHGGVVLSVIAPTKKVLREVMDTVDIIWATAGFTAQNEPFFTLPMFMACLPGGLLPDFDKKLRRGRTAPAKTWAMLSSLQGDSKGTQTPSYMFFTRKGQVAAIDLRDSDSNFNAFVSAPSGAGKSFLVNSFVTQTLSTGGRAFIIDIGRSYQQIAELVNGQLIEFKQDSDISLNLFALVSRKRIEEDEADMAQEDELEQSTLRAMLHRLLCQMVSPNQSITDTESAYLQNALDEVIAGLKEDESLTIDKLLACFHSKHLDMVRESKDNAYYNLGERLKKYGSEGRYGKWFSGRPNLNFQRPLVLLELEELKAEPELREVILLLIMGIIEQELYVTNDRSRHTIVILDEAWDVMGGANSAPFIESGFRRARKYLGSYIVITQAKLDLLKYPNLEQAINNNSAWQFFLAQKPDVVATMQEKNLLALDDYDIDQLNSVHTVKGVYSEIGVIYPSGDFTILRLIVPDMVRLAYSTDPVDVNCISRLKDMGYPLKEVLPLALRVLPLIREKHLDFDKAFRSILDADRQYSLDALLANGYSLANAMRQLRRAV
jgi:conjugal transfer ATP-binding protein TraC